MHWVRQPQNVGIAELHDGDTRKQFRDRTDTVERICGGRYFFLGIGVPVSSGPDQLLIDHKTSGESRQLRIALLGLKPGID